MNNQNYLIIYSKNNGDSETPLLGMKLFDKNEAKQYMKCVELLSDDSDDFEMESITSPYMVDDFTEIKLSASDLKFLNKIFELDENESKLGIFPDAINDAFVYNLIEEEYEE